MLLPSGKSTACAPMLIEAMQQQQMHTFPSAYRDAAQILTSPPSLWLLGLLVLHVR